MALRQIRLLGDEILTKPCREVTEITPRITELIDDMLDTMYEASGIGLAAPQVGVLRKVVVIDVWQEGMEELDETGKPIEPDEPEDQGEEAVTDETTDQVETVKAGEPEDTGKDDTEPEDEDEWEDVPGPLIMINPVITRTEGAQVGDEGCLSVPGKVGQVTRPNIVEVTYFDENMDEYDLEAEGLLARAICHEVDHLSGHMYVELVEGEIHDVGYDDSDDEESEDEESAHRAEGSE